MRFRLITLPLLLFPVCAQTPPVSEVRMKDAPVVFRSSTSVVPVTVVVRDSNGNAVGNLTADDFRLFDEGKPQYVVKFGMEAAEGKATAPKSGTPTTYQSPQEFREATATGQIADHFVAYLFDDLHLDPSDLARVKQAAVRHVATLEPLTRAAVYTTSATATLDFTGDREKLDNAILSIQAKAGTSTSAQTMQCPPMDYYFADMVERNAGQVIGMDNPAEIEAWLSGGSSALNIAVQDIAVCAALTLPRDYAKAVSNVYSAVRFTLAQGERDSSAALNVLKQAVARLAAMPGSRTVVLVSPGFLLQSAHSEAQTALIEQATRMNVVISALNARGLFTENAGGDAASRVLNASTSNARRVFTTQGSMAASGTLQELVWGTGGVLTENNNDMDEGFRRSASLPDYHYILSFSPREMKFDGKYHNLKVTLPNSKGYALQARKGYFAPNKATDPAELARQEIEETLFARNTLRDLPATLLTQFFKTTDLEANLSVIAKVDVSKMIFHKEDTVNRNDLTVVTALFNNDGNFLQATQKIVEMRFRDAALEARAANGISVKTGFTVKPGRYMVRMVVRDTEGQTMAAQSSVVEIP